MQEWDQLLLKLEKEWSQGVVAKWLRPLKKLRFDAANLYLEAPDTFLANWFEEHARPKIRLTNNNGRPIRIHLSIPGTAKPTPAKESYPSFSIQPDSLDPLLTHDQFIATGTNAIAHQLLLDPAGFNPIYIYGPSKTGKTHLLTAAAHLLKAQGKKVFFVRAETFTEHVVQAIRLGQMTTFRNVYRDIDALLVDEISLFAKKSATQEEFFHTFNTLHTLGKLILLTSELPPSKLTDIEPRLISRFEWGITLSLSPEDPAAVLRKKAANWNMPLSKELEHFLLKNFPKDPLLPLQALTIRAQEPVTLTVAEKLLKDLLEKEKQVVITPEQIVKTVASHYGVLSEDLLGKSQTREMAAPRQIAMYLIREKLKWPFQKIGEFFGRDHSTVMAAAKIVHKDLEDNTLDLSEILKNIG